VVQTGFPFFQQPGRPEATSRIDDFLEDGPPPIVFTLGSSVVHIADNFYRAAAEAARQLGRRAILLTGRNPAPTDLPATVLAVDYVPLESVLPRAAAVVHQGGIGTCAEALRAGIPSLVVPFGFDQPDNGERLRRLGVARVIRRERVTAATLAAKLRELLGDPAITARARELAGGIHPVADLERSLDAIERVGGASEKIAVALDAGIRQT
jgi:UDP:flavonoid glycosyltransferase YjiC (YdhE family)